MFEEDNENRTNEATAPAEAAASSRPAEGNQQAVASEPAANEAAPAKENVVEEVVEEVVKTVAAWIKCKSCNTEFSGERGTICPQCGAHTHLQV